VGRHFRRLSTLLLVAVLGAGASAANGRAALPASAHQQGTVRTGAPTAVPSKPFVASVSPRGLGALLGWAPNATSDQVTKYTATAVSVSTSVPPGCASPPPTVTLGTDSAMVVGHLCAQVAYTITLAATNTAGPGPSSAPSNPVVPLPAQHPSAPLLTFVFGRSGSLLVNWSKPDDDGGSPITGYALSATHGTQTVSVTPAASVTQASVIGLTNGTAYVLRLLAINAIGKSPPATGSGTPRAPYPPNPPQNFSAMADGSGGVKATWTAPVDTGGDAITGYRVTYQQVVRNSANTGWVPAPGSTPTTVAVSGSGASLTVSSLNPAAAYYAFSITAGSAAGEGQAASIASPVTPATQLTSKAMSLTKATMNALTSDVAGTLTWSAPAPSQVASIKVGQVLVGGTSPAAPHGLLATVQQISQPSSGTYVISTTRAALSDVLVNGSFAQSGDPLATVGGTFRAVAPGVRATRAAGITFSTTVALSLSVQQNLSANEQINVQGSVAITPTASIDLTINQGFLGIPDGATLSASAKVETQAMLTFGYKLMTTPGSPWRIEVAEIDGAPEEIPVGFAVIVLVPKIPVYLTASGEIDIGVSFTQTIGAAISWSTSDAGTLHAQNLSVPWSATAGAVPGLAVSGTAAVGLEARAEIEIFDVTGPYVQATLQLALKMDFNPPPGKPFLTVSPQVLLAVGWNINILIFNGQVQVTLATLSWPAFVIQIPPPVTLTVTPADGFVPSGQQLTFTATRSDGFVYPVTWSLLGGVQAESISSGGVFTAAIPGGRSLTVLARDSTGLMAQTTVSVETAPFDPPQNLTATYGSNGAAIVTWIAPANTGGAPLARYTVVTQPTTSLQTLAASATGTALTGLDSALSYVVDVYATNSAGLLSPAATALLQASWSIVNSPSPPGSQLSGVSCPAATFCMAAGNYYNGTNNQTLIENWNGRSWSRVSSYNTGSTQANFLNSVSCTSTSFCTATGSYYNGTNYQTLIEKWNGSSWSHVSSYNTSNTQDNVLNSVSCTSTTFCMAAGRYLNGTADQTLIETWNGSSWTQVGSYNSSSTQDNSLSGVSCASTSFCMAAGFYFNGTYTQNLIEKWNGSSWSHVSSYNSSTLGNYLSSVSCTSTSFCMAVGYSSSLSGPDTLTERWNGASWGFVGSPNAGGGARNDFLYGVSCTSTSFCMSAGYDNTSSAYQTLVEGWSGASWGIVGSPNSSGSDSFLYGVSCFTASFCMAVGSTAVGTLIEEY
jgi:hypothetical protein